MNNIFPIIWCEKDLLIDIYYFRSANLATLHSNANVNKAATDLSPPVDDVALFTMLGAIDGYEWRNIIYWWVIHESVWLAAITDLWLKSNSFVFY